MKFTTKEVNYYKEQTKIFLIEAIDWIKNHSELTKGPYGTAHVDNYLIHLTYTEGSPDKGSFTASYDEIYSLSLGALRSIFTEFYEMEKWKELFSKLQDIESFSSFHLANPDMSTFGFIVHRCLQEMSKDYDIRNCISKLNYDNAIFDNIFDSITGYILRDEVEIDFIYAIGGVRFKGSDFVYDENNNNMEFAIPNDKKREELSKFIRYQYSDYFGRHSVHQTLNWISNCTAWIKGKIVIPTPKSPQGKKLENMFIENTGIFPPQFLKEVLSLITGEKIEVKFFSITNENIFYKYRIEFVPFLFEGNPNSVSWGSSTGGIQYPNWMTNSYPLGHAKEYFTIDNFAVQFIKSFPRMRMKIKPSSFESIIFKRYGRIISSIDPGDLILETIILFESLVINQTRELSYRLRLRVSWMLGNQIEERKLIINLVKLMYSIRSDLVHNSGFGLTRKGSSLYKKITKMGGIVPVSDIAKSLVRLTLLKIIRLKGTNLEIMSKKEITKILDELILGAKSEFPSNKFYAVYSKNIFEELTQV